MLPVRLLLFAILPFAFLAAALVLGSAYAAAQPWSRQDIAALDPAAGGLLRVQGSVGTGAFGVPVAAGHDVDGDGFQDMAVASMVADPLGRTNAGQVFFVLGDGEVAGTLDSALSSPRLLTIVGDGTQELAGSEIWMDDVSGDGLGDLLIARQNFTPDAGRVGSGALTIIFGGPEWRELAASGDPLDLRALPDGVRWTTLVGPDAFARLGIWVRTGDVTGDGVADFVVGADQAGTSAERHRGSAYVVRGGAHLDDRGVVDLADFGATSLAGHVARILPPPFAAEFHLGATCQIADLDDNGRGEVLLAAALNRAGASIRASGAPFNSAHGRGGAPRGRLFIAWDDNFPEGPWPPGYSFDLGNAPGSTSVLRGGVGNVSFGEEILGGLDYDGDHRPDLFVGDIVGDLSFSRRNAGSGHVVFDAASVRGLDFAIHAPPAGVRVTNLLGGAQGDIAADTAGHGDFDGDGIDDLAIASPHGARFGRVNAGVTHVLYGQRAAWPARVDLADGALPPPEVLRITEIIGAKGEIGGDGGDTLAYSAAVGDIDGDGRTDFVTNEMLGNGATPAAEDAGNLIVLSGRLLAGGVDIDTSPLGHGPNIDPTKRRPFPVALLGSDAVDVHDLESISFGPAGAPPRFGENRRDVDRDGFKDVVVRFETRETGLAFSDRRACVDGMHQGEPFRACDDVSVTAPSCGAGWEVALVVPALLWRRRDLRSK